MMELQTEWIEKCIKSAIEADLPGVTVKKGAEIHETA
jgi:hypothetical protein